MDREPNYWLALFSDAGWRGFQAHGARVMGFREQRWRMVQRMRPGDYLLCYLTGISRFIGLLVVTAPPYLDSAPLWSSDPLPARVAVKPSVLLTPETAIPLTELRAQLSLFADRPGSWTVPLRHSPGHWPRPDGEQVAEALLQAQVEPVVRTLPQGGRQPTGLADFGVAYTSESATPVNVSGFREPASHSELQWLLLKLGNDMGLDVWVARNDRGRAYAGQRFSALPRLLAALPRQFEPATMTVIELIDVLWLRQGAILAAFEIECTTTIYSGLLRMADLIALQPNARIPLYLVAPEARRGKVMREINRPTFARLQPPLAQVCRYLPSGALRQRYQDVLTLLPYVDPAFIDAVAEPCQRA